MVNPGVAPLTSSAIRLDNKGGHMPKKIRELLQDLKAAGFDEIPGGKGSHRKLVHSRFRGAVTLSGQLGDDALPYQEKQVRRAIEEVQE